MRRFIKAWLIVLGFFLIVFISLGVFAPGHQPSNNGEEKLDTESGDHSDGHPPHEDAEDHQDVPKIQHPTEMHGPTIRHG